MVGASGMGLCFECSNQWDPTGAQAIVVDPANEEVLRTHNGLLWARNAGDPETFTERMESLEGGTAILEGGQVGTVVTFKGSTHVVVELSTGDIEVVPVEHVERVTPPPPPVVEVPVSEADPNAAADIEMTMLLASIIVKAGIASVTGSGDDVTPGVPPSEFLPTDPELMPVIERAACVAIGMMITTFKLDPDVMLAALEGPEDVSAEGDPTMEVSSDASPGSPA